MSLPHSSAAVADSDVHRRDSAFWNPSEWADVSPPCPVDATQHNGAEWDEQCRTARRTHVPPLAASGNAIAFGDWRCRRPLRILILLLLCVLPVHAEDAPVDANCGPRCVDFLVEYLDLPNEELSSIITEFDALDELPGVTFQQLAQAFERRGLTVSAYSLPTDSMIESDAPVVLHLHPLGSNSLGHFTVLLPTSTPTNSEVWVGVEGVQSGSPLELRKQMSGETIAVSRKPGRTVVRPLSSLRIALAENYHWLLIALPGLAIILLALLLMKQRTVLHLSPPVLGDPS